jgi:RND superfamily putative drug exporter
MFIKLMAFNIRFRYPLAIFWLLLAAVVFFVTPSLNSVAGNDQATFLPGNVDSIKASKMLTDLFDNKGGRSSAIVMVKRESGLTERDRNYLNELEAYLDKNKSSLFIGSIMSPYMNKEMEKELISADKKAAMLSLSLTTPSYKEETNETVLELKRILGITKSGSAIATAPPPIRPEDLKVAVTGDAVMSQEENENVNKSMDLTVKITIVLVLIILIFVYRSPIAPIISLATVGVSFSIARGIIAALVQVGFRVSSFTETFLIAVLFGAGTDYCLLLMSRYKEGLSEGKPSRDALIDALPRTGAAIISSGGTVIVGFLFMIFAKFGLFNATGPSVAIGVSITLLAVLTLLPAIIAILGEKIFWPRHPSSINSKPHISASWQKISETVTKKPFRFIITSLVVLLPFFIAAGFSSRSYDQLQELPSSTSSIQGFNMMKESFDQGKLMPLKIVMKTDKYMWSAQSLQTIDAIAGNLAKADNVLKVRTATRPLGEKITEASLPSQLDRLTTGMTDLGGSFSPLIKGLDDMQTGIDKISSGLQTGSSDMARLADGTKAAAQGVASTGDGLVSLSSGTASVANGLDQLAKSLDLLKSGLGSGKQNLTDITAALQGTQKLLEGMAAQTPALAANENYQRALGTLKQVLPGLEQLGGGLGESQQGLASAQGGLTSSAAALENIKAGIQKANSGLDKIKASLTEIEQGQRKAAAGVSEVPAGLDEISGGLEKSSNALTEMNKAFNQIEDASTAYTKNSNDSNNPLGSIFFLPPEVLVDYPEFKDAMENYIAPSSNAVIFEVILAIPPYTSDALDTVKALKSDMAFSLNGTVFEGAEFHVGGATAVLSEVRDVTSKDFILVMCLVLLGIFVVLVILLRSFVAPVYLILTIIFSYITTIGISYLFFQVILGYDGLHWTVQFFSFCVLVALGVDYNIFLISRIKEEYKPGDVKGSVQRALAATGGIITSCGIIMAGTFGAMMASPIKPLLEIGFTASVGLLLDTFIIRCLLVPAITVKMGELNWWPGRRIKVIAVDKDGNEVK